ncbi:hypothetical protein [Cyclobacterium marinum]|uniref:Protein involved in gliding motility RemB n=1 Tax=Cyclobacterium marinum (strain ATCC 25205 / DSM 745 / LMG 13164 / NCIMB 1802) TaxID=880070 RepID=G0J263_CYCMS|nr:hypothetical protein [Cyclobacterium marinum]AEL24572.1 hypothetical protein Cycma_0798 [Cyclobacterium marinum DSM 745]|tara:strand:- start:84097 stop:85767 length:1671 start_codon:yes stop_codon:yes gene_type:complete
MKYFFLFLLFTGSLVSEVLAQSPYLPFNRDYYSLLERYEIKNGAFNGSFHTGSKPYRRDEVVQYLEEYKKTAGYLNKKDEFNLNYLLQDNWEYATDSLALSKRSIGKYIYKRPSDFYGYKSEDFDVHLNPVLYLQGGAELDNDQMPFRNTRGLALHGSIDDKIGFYTMLATTDLMFPSWVNEYVGNHGAIPGQGFWKRYGDGGYSFFSARGHITFSATKHVNIQMGHDSHFIGEGLRSFILSDFSNPFVFVKVNTKIGKVDFTNLWGQMTADIITSRGVPTDGRYPQKWFSFHRLGVNLGRRFNLGVFESVMADKANWNYFNPLIFYRWVEHQLGTPDKVMLGTDMKWNLGKGMQLYGQFVLDEFVFDEFFHITESGSSRNKHGVQLGYKYIDVAGIDNLDFQLEYNQARPFTFQEKFDYQSYTNYRIPLTHPRGANFRELLAVITYQPLRKLMLRGTMMYQMYGADPTEEDNYGGDILKNRTQTSTSLYGNYIGQGQKNKVSMATLHLQYMLRHNLFVDLSQTMRHVNTEGGINSKTSYGQLALRLNISRFDQQF